MDTSTQSAIHLCSGYGGWELALKRSVARVYTACHVEWDPYAQAVLVERMGQERLDKAPIWDDIATFDGKPFSGKVDWVTAGFPCQPFSLAGLGLGTQDNRWLWPHIARIISDVAPRFVLLENVPQLVKHGLSEVLYDLAKMGFDAEWGLYTAAQAGAPHERERAFILAYTDGPRLQESWTCRPTEKSAWPPLLGDATGSRHWQNSGGPQPSLRRLHDGPPVGLAESLHLGGNGMIPAQAVLAITDLVGRLSVRR
jgi:DNA (cytosine-5)-methyltransferase 1